MAGEQGYRSYVGDEVVTGEGVAVELPIASLPLRLASGAIDVILTYVLLIAVGIAAGVLTASSSRAVVATAVLLSVILVAVGLPTILETVTRGRTVGKLVLGLRTVRDDGGPITARHALTRAMIGFVEIYALTGAPALITALISPRSKRLGDLAAGTHVVSQRAKLLLVRPPDMPPALEHWARSADIATLPSGLAIAIRQFLARAPGLSAESRASLGTELLGRTLPHCAPPPPGGHHPETILAAVIAERRERDARRLARDARLRERVLR
jgi:uncharacterized RDD family membrane protein YckC